MKRILYFKGRNKSIPRTYARGEAEGWGYNLKMGSPDRHLSEYDYFIFEANDIIPDSLFNGVKGKPTLILVAVGDLKATTGVFYRFAIGAGLPSVKFHSPAPTKLITKYNVIKDFYPLETRLPFFFESLAKGAKPLARNQFDEVLCWRYNNLIFIAEGISDGYPTSSSLADVIALLGLFNEKSSPTWASNYLVAGEKENLEDLRKTEEEIKTARKKSDLINKELKRCGELKSILWEEGLVLERRVGELFKEMGLFNEPEYEEDFIIPSNEIIVVEVKSIRGNLDDRRRREIDDQLAKHREMWLQRSGSEPKLCLVINHEVDKDPKLRNPLDEKRKDLLVTACGVCIIPVTTLLVAFNKFKKGKLDNNKFIEKIVKTEGVLLGDIV